MIAPARVAALEVLEAVSAGRADLPSALASIRGSLRDERDQALVIEIAAGVQRWRAALDYLIGAFSKRPIERLDPEVLEILRLSAYQLLHLTRVPASAVVDDAVDLAKRAGKASAAGFVNAVLRTLSRRRAALPLPPRPADASDRTAALDYLAISLSHPRWLAARWYDRYGFDATERWLRFNNSHPRLVLRANRLKAEPPALADALAAEDVAVTPSRFAPDALIVEHGSPLGGRLAENGWFVVQDEASQLVAQLAGPAPGRRVLDACAAPGGKATALAAAMGGRGLLAACDVRPRRIELLRRVVATTAAANVRLVLADLTRPLPFGVPFECVLADVPCSGLGTLRRDPDIRWDRQEKDLAGLAATQRTMLAMAADQVAPGGRLIYATCSSEPEENEAVADAFLATRSDFIPVDARSIEGFPSELVDDRGRFQTRPHLHDLDAFFGAVFERRRDAVSDGVVVRS